MQGDVDAAAKERLRASYRQFWGNAVTLAREIQRDLPQLTLHDETHFEALWQRADQIAGADYRLTPLEVFVLGGAILLHDAANSLAAYPGGLAEVQATPEWRDAVEDWRERHELEPTDELSKDALGAILLETLRSIHAERARTLALFEVTINGHGHALLQDDQLRVHLGPLIGEIAASHHWDIAKLTTRLGGQRGALAGMPPSWTIRPIIIACLLRCADATQLDQSRTPDFLYGLLHLHGVSEAHWRAQNRLAHPHIDAEDPSALVFSSTYPFVEADAPAWWIAYDAIAVAHRELQAANNLLRDKNLPSFQITRVRGAESSQRLAEHVRVDGWRPVAAEVTATRVDKIVDMFGGEQLYGKQPFVPVRELIQNAADAVRFRRELEPGSSIYEGRITVRLRDDGADHVQLEVEDDGIGMSEAVMTGPLIDFGSSYISSSLVKSERPGLLSKGRKRIGRYGVGFFSAFMIADEIHVTSRPFDQGLDAARTLRFSHGTAVRPVLLDRHPSDFGVTVSTRVSLRVAREALGSILTTDPSSSGNEEPLDLFELVGALCPMLDCDVHVEAERQTNRVHARLWYEEDRETWLKQLLPAKLRRHHALAGELEAAAKRLTFIDPAEPSMGLAAVAAMGGTGVQTVGTLLAASRFGQPVQDFSGAIDYQPGGPRRAGKNASAERLLPAWATQQAELAAAINMGMPHRQYVARRVAQFKGDASPIAMVRLERQWVSLKEAVERAHALGTVYVPFKGDDVAGKRLVMTVARERQSGFIDNYGPGELEFVVSVMEGEDVSGYSEYYAIPTDTDPAAFSFLSMFNRAAATQGLAVAGEFLERADFARYVGEDSPREDLLKGKLIGGPALKLYVHAMT